ncbi:unnamed protein product [Camellia sinensis]
MQLREIPKFDYESLISTTNAELLKRAWRTEKATPEILQFEASLVQRSRNPLADFNEKACSPFVKKYKTIIHPRECRKEMRSTNNNALDTISAAVTTINVVSKTGDKVPDLSELEFEAI